MKIKINLIKREHDKPGELEAKIKRYMKILRKIKKFNRKCSCTLKIREAN